MFDAHIDLGSAAKPLGSESSSAWSREKIIELLEVQDQFFASGQTRKEMFRRGQLESLRRVIKKYDVSITEALALDLRKSSVETYMTEIGVVLTEIREALAHLHTWMRVESKRTPLVIAPARSELRREPYGKALIISPWNFPVLLTLGPLIGAIAAGNVAVIKPSELAPATAQVLCRIISEAFPQEQVAIVTGDAGTSTLLLEQRWDVICFTGGTEVGRTVALAAARHLTPCILELGGKSPCIVTERAEIEQAARRIVWGKFLNVGQVCVAPDYVLAQSSIYDEFVKALHAEVKRQYGEHPLSNPQLGRVINTRHFKRLMALIEPEKIAFGGRNDPAALLLEPTVLVNVTLDDEVMREEIFGPILPIVRFHSLAEAKVIVQSFEKPLALYVFTRDRTEQEMFVSELSYGGGCINDVLLHTSNSALPFGGVGASGMQAYHGRHGFEAFSHRKGLVYGATWIDPPLRYGPWDRFKTKVFRLFLR